MQSADPPHRVGSPTHRQVGRVRDEEWLNNSFRPFGPSKYSGPNVHIIDEVEFARNSPPDERHKVLTPKKARLNPTFGTASSREIQIPQRSRLPDLFEEDSLISEQDIFPSDSMETTDDTFIGNPVVGVKFDGLVSKKIHSSPTFNTAGSQKAQAPRKSRLPPASFNGDSDSLISVGRARSLPNLLSSRDNDSFDYVLD